MIYIKMAYLDQNIAWSQVETQHSLLLDNRVVHRRSRRVGKMNYYRAVESFVGADTL